LGTGEGFRWPNQVEGVDLVESNNADAPRFHFFRIGADWEMSQ
jgi:hypothetical protein